MELQVMRMCTRHDSENVNRVMAGYTIVGWEVTLEKMCFKSLSERRSRIYEASVERETVPGGGASDGDGPFSESFCS